MEEKPGRKMLKSLNQSGQGGRENSVTLLPWSCGFVEGDEAEMGKLEVRGGAGL